MDSMIWIKSMTNMYESEAMRLIDVMPERDTIHFIYIRLKIQAGRTNDCGHIYYKEDIPYTNEMLAIIFNRPIEAIELALSKLKELNLIDIEEGNYIRIIDWEAEQNVKAMENAKDKNRKRVAEYRERRKRLKEKIKDDVITGNPTVTDEESLHVLIGNEDVMVQKEEENIDVEVEEESLNKKNNKDLINSIGYKVLSYYENVTGKKGVFKLPALNRAIGIHGEIYVRLAIDKAIEINKINMTYVNGILNNWLKEGYPKEDELNGARSSGKDNSENKSKFYGFKADKPGGSSGRKRGTKEKKLI